MLRFLYLFVCLTSIAQAEISINNEQLSINNGLYDISQDLGQTVGNNLFHTFEQFNLNQGEIAQFSGSDSIQNIISRVIGGESSFINGTLRSSIPNADFYFLNPYGIVFGESAQLDLQGSFHASTADYLKLSNGGEFHARFPERDILTIASVASFGFLNNSPASLSVENSQLKVLENKSLSLTASNLLITNAKLTAPAGQIYLASIGNIGEVIPNQAEFANYPLQGNVTISQQSEIDSSGNHAGGIFIRSGQFVLDNSKITAQTVGSQNGEQINIAANNIALQQGANIDASVAGLGDGADIKLFATDEITASIEREDGIPNRITAYSKPSADSSETGDLGDIALQANNITFQDGSSITNQTNTSGQGGNIVLNAEQSITFKDEGSQEDGYPSSLRVITTGQAPNSGNSGEMLVTAKQITIRDGAAFHARTFGAADTGNIALKASDILIEDSLVIGLTFVKGNTGTITFEAENDIRFQTGDIYNLSLSAGDAGNIRVKAKNIFLHDSSYIMSIARRTGHAGNVSVETSDKLSITGNNHRDGWGWASGIHSNSAPTQAGGIGGDGGNITIRVGELFMRDGGLISTNSASRLGLNAGKGGDIDIEADTIDIAGINPYGRNDEGFETGIHASSVGVGDNGNDSGNIRVRAQSLSIADGAKISSSTDNYASSGTIDIAVQDSVSISGDSSVITPRESGTSQVRFLEEFTLTSQLNQSTSGIYASSQDNNQQSGDAGSIILVAKNLVLTDKGMISTSSAGGGRAGNIHLDVSQLQMDSSARITSENQLINRYQFTSEAERDNTLIGRGDVIEVKDLGNGEKGNYINIGSYLIQTRIAIEPVDNIQALQELSSRFRVFEGQIVEVKDAGDGRSARFIYSRHRRADIDTWERVRSDVTTVLDNPQAILSERNDGGYKPDEELPDNFNVGERIKVQDMGDGKSAEFIYTTITSPDKLTYVRFIRINQFELNTEADLQALTEQVSFEDQNPIATVLDNNSQFIYANNQWIAFNNQHQVDNVPALTALTLAKTGNIATITDSAQQMIYTGQKWIDLNPQRRVVQTVDELEQLPANQGDLVKVSAQNQVDNYFYADGQWIKQERGGNAGTITVQADTINLTGNSAITTEAISSGGGGITLYVDNLLFLNENSQVSTSVQEGAGNGGNLTIGEPQFLVMNHAELIAQAYEGQGGNIRIVAEQFVKNPSSLVSASSQLGIDGNVQISSPSENVSNDLFSLSKNFIKDIKIEDKCKTSIAERLSNKYQSPLTLKVSMYRPPNNFIEDLIPSSAKYLNLVSNLGACISK